VERLGGNPQPSVGLRSPSHGLGTGPQKGTPCPGPSDHDRRGLCAFGPQGALPCAEPARGRPAAGLERGGALGQAQGERPTDWGRLPGGPGPFDQGPPGRGRPRLGPAALLTPAPPGLCRWRQPQSRQALSGLRAARPVAPRRHGRPGHGARDPAQGLEGFAPGSEAPGLDRRGAVEGPTPSPVRLGRDGLDGCLPRRSAAPGWDRPPRCASAGARDARWPDP
jgi:hypothetical protein